MAAPPATAAPSGPVPEEAPRPAAAGPDVASDLRHLLRTAEGADTTLKVGGASVAVHRGVLAARSAGFRELFAACPATGPATVPLGGGCSAGQLTAILELLYAGSDGRATWDTEEWSELLGAALELGLEDVTGLLIEWREEQTQGQRPATALRGAGRHRVGWKADAAADDEAACLSFSFELEGNGLQILDYYRPEGTPDAAWLALSLHERHQRIRGNWALLKRRVDGPAARRFYWLNPNLTIEDAGFLWEVSYGGDSPGYTLDVAHLCDELHAAVDAGLTLGDREMDSGVQAHVAFPFLEPADAPVRAAVFALLVQLDDHLFLRDFDRAVIDNCNNTWSSADVADLFGAAAAGADAVRALVTHGHGAKAMPNPQVKHKHVGLRGADTYHCATRYGFELRRGHSLEQLEDTLTYLAGLFAALAPATADTLPVRFHRGPASRPHAGGAALGAIRRFVGDPARRVAPALAAPEGAAAGEQAFGVALDRLDALGEPWVRRLVEWEGHLVNTKLLLWQSSPEEKPECAEERRSAVTKVRQRVLFVLASDFSGVFPDAPWNWAGEQEHLRHRVNGCLGQRRRAELRAQDTPAGRHELLRDDTQLEELRGLVVDFARRLATLY